MISEIALNALADSGMSAHDLVKIIVADRQVDKKIEDEKIAVLRQSAAERQRKCRERKRVSRDVTSVTVTGVTDAQDIENPQLFPSNGHNLRNIYTISKKVRKKEERKKERISA